MRKILILLIITISSVGLFAQTDYYWYKGQKIFLEIQPNKKYILYETSISNSSIAQSLGVPGNSVLNTGNNNLSKSIKRHKKYTHQEKNWVVIDNPQIAQTPTSNNENIVYEACFYKTQDNREAGLSHLFYVKLKASNDVSTLEALAKENNVEIVGNNAFMPLWYTLSCKKQSKGNALKMANKFYESGLFEAAEPDLMPDNLTLCTNDTYFNNQWGLNNVGQNGGTSGFDINFCDYKHITTGSQNIVIAVLDHGVELNHPDMTNMFAQSFDTETGTSPSVVRGSHGTACAGIIGANSNNNLGISGIAPKCPIMSISNRLMVSVDAAQNLANGFNFARIYGASVISNSWGHSLLQSTILDEAITAALTEGRNGFGCVVVFAAGNGNSSVIYPANSNPDIIAVGAASPCGQRKSFTSCDGESWGSCFGPELDIMAPGVLIPTTDRQGSYGYNNAAGVAGDYYQRFNGTSSATPHVAAVAGLILSINPNLTQREVADIIESTAQKIGAYVYDSTAGRENGTWNNETGYGMLDAFAAVQAAQNTICPQNIVITEPINGGGHDYRMSNSITASNLISAGIVHYGASLKVKLIPGFKATNGSIFKADLDGCPASYSLKNAFVKPYAATSEELNEEQPISNEIALTKSFVRIYPNPATDKFEVLYNAKESFNIHIYDFSGKEVLSVKNSLKSKTVDISKLSVGLYFVKVSSGSYSVTQKLIKK